MTIQIRFDVKGFDFICFLTSYADGVAAAFPKWGICADLSRHPGDVQYNTDKIYSVLLRSSQLSWLPRAKKERLYIARCLAQGISDHLEELLL